MSPAAIRMAATGLRSGIVKSSAGAAREISHIKNATTNITAGGGILSSRDFM
jgi:hypothetical protein